MPLVLHRLCPRYRGLLATGEAVHAVLVDLLLLACVVGSLLGKRPHGSSFSAGMMAYTAA
jgi:hypothetical protein